MPMPTDGNSVLARRRIARRASEQQPDATESLFRADALRRRMEVTQPRPLAIAPPSWMVMTVVLGVTFAAALVFAFMGSIARKESAIGQLRPITGEIQLGAERPGTVSRLYVMEDSFVRAGTSLYDVRIDDTMLDGRARETLTLASLEQQKKLAGLQADARKAELEAQLAETSRRAAASRALVGRLHSQLENASRRRALAEDQVETTRAIVEKGFMTRTEARQRESAALLTRQQEEQLVIDLDRARQDEAASVLESRRLRARAAADNFQASVDLMSLEQRLIDTSQAGGYRVKAPVSGRISGLRANRGMHVQPGDTMLTLLPTDVPLVAELYVSTKAIGFVQAGQRVRLLYDAYPYQKFGAAYGTVVSVSRGVVRPEERSGFAGDSEPHYAVRVRLDRQTITAFGKEHQLKPGMLLRADLIQERRSILEWFIEPLLSSSQRM